VREVKPDRKIFGFWFWPRAKYLLPQRKTRIYISAKKKRDPVFFTQILRFLNRPRVFHASPVFSTDHGTPPSVFNLPKSPRGLEEQGSMKSKPVDWIRLESDRVLLTATAAVYRYGEETVKLKKFGGSRKDKQYWDKRHKRHFNISTHCICIMSRIFIHLPSGHGSKISRFLFLS